MTLKEAGVKLVADGAPQFDKAVANANRGMANLATSATSATRSLNLMGQVGLGAIREIGAVATRALVQAGQAAARFGAEVLSAALDGSRLEQTGNQIYSSLVQVTRISLTPLADQMSELAARAAPGLLGVVQVAQTYLGGLASRALTWGQNVATQFANGIVAGAVSVINALASLASQITYWLSPGSPPRLLPDIDKWGTGTIDAWLSGFGKGDFGVFNEIAGTVEAMLRSVSTGTDTGLIPSILGSREAIAEAVAMVKQAGQVTQAALDRILAGAGNASAALRNYVASSLELQVANEAVAAAQANVNKLIGEYDALLKPVDKQLAAISEEQQQLAENGTLAQLALVQQDPNATASEKRQAALESERIMAERNRRALLLQKGEAVDAATVELDAAKDKQVAALDQFEAAKALIQAQTDSNNLLREQVSLLDRISAAMLAMPTMPVLPALAGGGSGAGGGGKEMPGAPKFIKPDTSWLTALEEALKNLETKWAETWAAISTTMQPAVDAWNNDVVPAWDGLVDKFQSSLPAIESGIAQMVAFATQNMGVTLPGIFENVGKSLDSLAEIWDRHHGTVIAIVVGLFKFIWTTISVTLLIISGIIAVALRYIEGTFETWALALEGDWEGVWENVKKTLSDVWDTIKRTLNTALDSILVIVGQTGEEFKATWSGIWENVKTIVAKIWKEIGEAFQDFIIDLIAKVEETDWAKVGSDIIGGIAAGITGAAHTLFAAAVGAALGALQAAKDALLNRSPSKRAAEEIGKPFSLGIAQGILKNIGAVQAAGQVAALSAMSGGRVYPVASAAQIMRQSAHYDYSRSAVINYQPQYSTPARGAAQDFAIMQSLYGAAPG